MPNPVSPATRQSSADDRVAWVCFTFGILLLTLYFQISIIPRELLFGSNPTDALTEVRSTQQTTLAPVLPERRLGSASIFSSDNRPLMDTYEKIRADGHGYFSVSAVLNYLYAKQWGYTYIHYHMTLNVSEFGPDFYRPEYLTDQYKLDRYPKMKASCAHLGQKELRLSSWCKLLPCWLHASMQHDLKHRRADSTDDFALYLDSDAIVLADNISIADYVNSEAAARGHTVSWGQSLTNATITFLSNRGPWGAALQFPVAGVFWFRPGLAASRFFEHWWDVRDRQHSFFHAFEQESMWLWVHLYKSIVSILDVVSMGNFPGNLKYYEQ
jgi:hypothetical protein